MGHVIAGVLGQARPLKLNGRMRNVEVGFESRPDTREDFFALVHVHIRNADVAGKRMEIGADCPNVDVVNFLNAVDAQDRTGYGLPLRPPFGSPSRRTFPASRRRPLVDQSTIAAITTPIAGSSHCAPVIRIATAPARMPRFEMASPKLCRNRLRRLRSRLLLTSASVIPPLMASASSETPIIQLSWTATGCRNRSNASQNRIIATTISKIALVNAARMPAR